ncbi:MAG: HlyD family efflux transporter periplasmic adaptor subunit [Lentisphaeria bacterium]|nr:HlyD family efflux transporter periplasmic adaptor subunit [Lentisphaeria bacterium]
MGEYRTTAGEQLPEEPLERKRRVRNAILKIFIVLVVIVVTGFAVPINRYATAQGYVTTKEYAEVRSPVTGIVSNILIHSGDMVEAGQVMVELNSSEEEATLAETRARVSKLHTEMERRQAEMSIDLERRSVELTEQKRAHADNLRVAELELANAESRLELTGELVEKGLKAQRELEDVRLQKELCQVRLESLQRKDFKIYEDLLARDRTKYDSEIHALEEELAALEESVRRAEARIELRKIRAPISGQVVRYEFVNGELLQPNYVIYEIFGGEDQILKLRVDERYATRIAGGQKYRAKLSTYKNGFQRIYFRGQVQYLRNIIQNDGEKSYRMAYCLFHSRDYVIPPGTTAEARIYYDRSCFWSFLFNLEP